MVEQTENSKQLTPADLPKKAWWRFAQAVFVLVAILLLVLTAIATYVEISDADTLVESETTIWCDNGQSFNLGSFADHVGGFYVIRAKDIKNSRFIYYANDAKVKMFCGIYGGEGTGDPFSYSKTVYSAFSLTELEDISSREYSKQGVDFGYSVESVLDNSPILEVVRYAILAIFIEIIILLTVRGIARYTLVGKFL